MPKNQHAQRIFLKQSYDELWFVKSCQNCTFKVNFLCQKSTEYQFRRPFFVKNFFFNLQFLNHFIFQNPAQFLSNWRSPYSQNTMVSFEYIGFWPKILLFRFHHLLTDNLLHTVWPQPIWIKVRTLWQIPSQLQSTYLGGPESASI